MKKLFILFTMMLLAVSVSAQHHGHDKGRHDVKRPVGGHFEPRGENHRDFHGEKRFDLRSDRHFDHRDNPRFNEPRGHSGHGFRHSEIRCTRDRQDLWNGCHVRMKVGRVYVYDRDDRLLWGDEVVLLPNGCYKVRNGSFWYVHNHHGDRIGNIWGDLVDLLSNGLFRCRRAGMDF